MTHRGRAIPELGQSFDGVERPEIALTFDLQIAQLHRKVPKRIIEVVLHLTLRTAAVMKLLVNLAKADPIRAHRFDTLLARNLKERVIESGTATVDSEVGSAMEGGLDGAVAAYIEA